MQSVCGPTPAVSNYASKNAFGDLANSFAVKNAPEVTMTDICEEYIELAWPKVENAVYYKLQVQCSIFKCWVGIESFYTLTAKIAKNCFDILKSMLDETMSAKPYLMLRMCGANKFGEDGPMYQVS